jgi:hypothetical protein
MLHRRPIVDANEDFAALLEHLDGVGFIGYERMVMPCYLTQG